MSVARHLQIDLAEYDSRIRTFIPDYDEMLDSAAGVLSGRERVVVDLGIGTGALAERCLRRAARARIVGVDSDPEMLALARRRLAGRADVVHATFARAAIPACDAAVAALALHHVRTRTARSRLYARLATALRPGGVLVSADCYPARDVADAGRQRDAWVTHLRQTYSVTRAARLLRAWAEEDVYVPLGDEIGLLESLGYRAEIVWRRGMFAVLAARPGRRTGA